MSNQRHKKNQGNRTRLRTPRNQKSFQLRQRYAFQRYLITFQPVPSKPKKVKIEPVEKSEESEGARYSHEEDESLPSEIEEDREELDGEEGDKSREIQSDDSDGLDMSKGRLKKNRKPARKDKRPKVKRSGSPQKQLRASASVETGPSLAALDALGSLKKKAPRKPIAKPEVQKPEVPERKVPIDIRKRAAEPDRNILPQSPATQQRVQPVQQQLRPVQQDTRQRPVIQPQENQHDDQQNRGPAFRVASRFPPLNPLPQKPHAVRTEIQPRPNRPERNEPPEPLENKNQVQRFQSPQKQSYPRGESPIRQWKEIDRDPLEDKFNDARYQDRDRDRERERQYARPRDDREDRDYRRPESRLHDNRTNENRFTESRYNDRFDRFDDNRGDNRDYRAPYRPNNNLPSDNGAQDRYNDNYMPNRREWDHRAASPPKSINNKSPPKDFRRATDADTRHLIDEDMYDPELGTSGPSPAMREVRKDLKRSRDEDEWTSGTGKSPKRSRDGDWITKARELIAAYVQDNEPSSMQEPEDWEKKAREIISASTFGKDSPASKPAPPPPPPPPKEAFFTSTPPPPPPPKHTHEEEVQRKFFQPQPHFPAQPEAGLYPNMLGAYPMAPYVVAPPPYFGYPYPHPPPPVPYPLYPIHPMHARPHLPHPLAHPMQHPHAHHPMPHPLSHPHIRRYGR